MAENIEAKIKKTLTKIRPHLQMDGGDVAFVAFDNKTGILQLKLQGACSHCPMSQVTLQDGVGRLVIEEVPAVKKVVAV